MELYEGKGESLERLVVDGVTIFRWRGPRTANEGLEVARFDRAMDLLTIFPRMPSGISLEDQYSQVNELQVDTGSLGLWDPEYAVTDNADGSLELNGLPEGFGKIFALGRACGASTGS